MEDELGEEVNLGGLRAILCDARRISLWRSLRSSTRISLRVSLRNSLWGSLGGGLSVSFRGSLWHDLFWRNSHGE
jgi:hypothetical protein